MKSSTGIVRLQMSLSRLLNNPSPGLNSKIINTLMKEQLIVFKELADLLLRPTEETLNQIRTTFCTMWESYENIKALMYERSAQLDVIRGLQGSQLPSGDAKEHLMQINSLLVESLKSCEKFKKDKASENKIQFEDILRDTLVRDTIPGFGFLKQANILDEQNQQDNRYSNTNDNRFLSEERSDWIKVKNVLGLAQEKKNKDKEKAVRDRLMRNLFAFYSLSRLVENKQSAYVSQAFKVIFKDEEALLSELRLAKKKNKQLELELQNKETPLHKIYYEQDDLDADLGLNNNVLIGENGIENNNSLCSNTFHLSTDGCRVINWEVVGRREKKLSQGSIPMSTVQAKLSYSTQKTIEHYRQLSSTIQDSLTKNLQSHADSEKAGFDKSTMLTSAGSMSIQRNLFKNNFCLERMSPNIPLTVKAREIRRFNEEVPKVKSPLRPPSRKQKKEKKLSLALTNNPRLAAFKKNKKKVKSLSLYGTSSERLLGSYRKGANLFSTNRRTDTRSPKPKKRRNASEKQDRIADRS